MMNLQVLVVNFLWFWAIAKIVTYPALIILQYIAYATLIRTDDFEADIRKLRDLISNILSFAISIPFWIVIAIGLYPLVSF